MAALHHHTQQRSQTKLRTTVQDVPTDLELNLEASGKSHYLVRVQHPSPPNLMQALKVASGDKYLQYIPYDTYVVAMEFHMKSRVEAINGVEAVYHLPAGMKISPALNELMVKTKNMLPSNAKDVFINADPMHPEKRGNTHFHDRDPMDHPRNRFNSATQKEKHMKQTRMTNKGSSGMNFLNQADVNPSEGSKAEIEVSAPVFLEVSVSLQDDKTSTVELLKSWESFFASKTGKIAQVWAKSDNKFSIETNFQHLDLIVNYLANQAAVKYIERRMQYQTLNMHASLVVKGAYKGESIHDGLQKRGLNGTGQIVGISDTGIDFDSCFFHDAQRAVYVCNNCYMYNYGGCSLQCPSRTTHRKIISYNSFTPPPPAAFSYDSLHGHGTHVAGTVAGAASPDHSLASQYNGTAAGAKIVFDDISNTDYYLNYLPWDLYHGLYPHAYENGARVHSNSWGSGGGSYYYFTSHETDAYMYDHDDFLIVFAAGNSGPYHFSVGSPASAKNVLSVGSSMNTREAYIAHGYGEYYNLSLSMSDGMYYKLLDILPATFGLPLTDSMTPLSAPVVMQDFNNFCYINSYYLWGSRCSDLSSLLCLPVQESGRSCSADSNHSAISGTWQNNPQLVGYDYFSGHVSVEQTASCSSYSWPVPQDCVFNFNIPVYDASSTVMELIIEVGFIWYTADGFVSRVSSITVDGEYLPFDTSKIVTDCSMTMSYVHRLPATASRSIQVQVHYDPTVDPYYGACWGSNSGVIAYLLSNNRPSWDVLYDSASQTNSNYNYYSGEFHLTQVDVGMDFCILGHNSSQQLIVTRSGSIFFGSSSQLIDLPLLRVDEEAEFRPSFVAGKRFQEQGVQGYSLFVRAYTSEYSMYNEFQINLFSNRSITISFGAYGDTADYVQLMIRGFAVHSFLPRQRNSYMISNFENTARSYFRHSFTGKIILAPYISYYSGTCDEAVMASNAQFFGAVGLLLYQPYRQSEPLHLTGSSRPDVARSITIPVAGVAGLDVYNLQSLSKRQTCISGTGSLCYYEVMSGQLPVVSAERTAQSFQHTDLSYFSSRGPTFDLRNKPDIVAPGQNIFSASSDGLAQSFQCASSIGMQDSCIVEKSGTSMATPAAAGAAAIVRQYFTEGFHARGARNVSAGINPSSALVKAMIIQSGRQVRNLAISGSRLVRDRTWGYIYASEGNDWQWKQPDSSPSVEQGYGLMNLSAVLWFGNESDFTLKVLDRQQITQGASQSLCFNVVASSSFRVTLVWTDPPASMYSTSLLINNLDLLVVDQAGNLWYGNNRTGQSPDRVNNVEQITIPAAAGGLYRVIVVGSDVPQGPQSFALVVTGDFEQSTQCSGTLTCPAGCSGRGTCLQGLCTCSQGYTGFGCETTLTCGDGVVSDSEECDDGNTRSSDGCSSSCTIEDSFACEQELWPGKISRCSKCSCGCVRFTEPRGTVSSQMYPNTGSSSSCVWDIEPASLTNLQISFPKTTENANLNVDFYMCSDAACSSWNYAGWMSSTSSNLWMVGSESFSRGIRSSQPRMKIVSRSQFLLHYGPITYDVCGDGIQEGREFCDDGNTDNGDGCSSSCKKECLLSSCCHFDLSPYDLFARKFDEEVAAGANCATFSIDSSTTQTFMETELAIAPTGMQQADCPFSPTLFEPVNFQLYGSATQSELRNISSGGWNLLHPSSIGYSQSMDDSSWLLPDFGFDFCFQGVNVRARTYVSSNSYLTFFQGFSYYSGLSPSWPPVPTLFIGGSDNSVQLLLSKRVNEGGRAGLVIRFEGTASTSGVTGDPNIIWEVTFFDDNSIRTSIGRLTNSGGLSLLSDGRGGTTLLLPFREKSALKLTITDLCHVSQNSPCDLLTVTSSEGSSIVPRDRFQVFRSQSISLSFMSNVNNRTSAFPFNLSWGFKSKPTCGNGLRDWTFVIQDKRECNAEPTFIYDNMFYGYYYSPISSCSTTLRAPKTSLTQLFLIVEMDMVSFYSSTQILNVTLNGVSLPLSRPSASSYASCGSYQPVVKYKIPSSLSGPSYNISISTLYASCRYCSQTYSPSCKVFYARAYLATVDEMEECDDGNQVSRDGCDSSCRIETGGNCSTSDTEDKSFQQGPDVCMGDLSYLGSRLSVCSSWMTINGSSSFPWLWGDNLPVGYKTCKLPYTWEEILVPRMKNCSLDFKTGGLGYLMTSRFQSWFCVKHHPCAWDALNPFFCFVYDEDNRVFVPWGSNSELKLVRLS
ncbi:hypothetical protein GUITHDRAFT_116999 [Guillardia theta CCMP2712]|uniref:Peptidase S8/S53 domain-containing protein n=1 Tax=Guillardia theta (strain CCMP2712) TaxID=905079 RepID=L1IKR3_GUITC|nr:hypothetical protein GUITHDRAFT_116999 [Guillardia theta CCMP2712]EKX36833.1 hypothetical protein GUITHDRAFT_116999 [Guillardia theta CCMP2712]|eukprot:XP_005823813.1 hypothetical protein GUITHDRAFT_116999 [Guillardia theta CCMP2712]